MAGPLAAWRPAPADLTAARNRTIPDVTAPGLQLDRAVAIAGTISARPGEVSAATAARRRPMATAAADPASDSTADTREARLSSNMSEIESMSETWREITRPEV